MKTTTFVIRTRRGSQIMAYDDLERAKVAMRKFEQKIGISLQIVRVDHIEEVIA